MELQGAGRGKQEVGLVGASGGVLPPPPTAGWLQAGRRDTSAGPPAYFTSMVESADLSTVTAPPP